MYHPQFLGLPCDLVVSREKEEQEVFALIIKQDVGVQLEVWVLFGTGRLSLIEGGLELGSHIQTPNILWMVAKSVQRTT